jgi:hypothetical protein
MQIIVVLVLLFVLTGATAAEGAKGLTEDEHLELSIYRARFPQIEAERSAAQGCDAACVAYRDYRVAYYKRLTTLGEHEIAVFAWQLKASGVMLWLVTSIAMQLWMGTRPRRKMDQSVDLEISLQRIRLQSSVIGISVLAISVAFFLIFVQTVYRVNVLPIAPIEQAK